MPVGKVQKLNLGNLKRAIRVRGIDALDRRTSTSKAMAQYRSDLVNALGGPQHISPQRETLVDAITRTKLFIDSLDVWLIERGDHIINKRKRQCIAVLRERQSLVDSMARLLSMIGLDRVEIIPTLEQHFAARNAQDDESSAPEPPESQESAIESDETPDGAEQISPAAFTEETQL